MEEFILTEGFLIGVNGIELTSIGHELLASETLKRELKIAGEDKKLQYEAQLKYTFKGHYATALWFKLVCKQRGTDIYNNPLIDKDYKFLLKPEFIVNGKKYAEVYV